MKWYHNVACFCAGFFLTNTVPHFVHGVSGDSFPSPFAHGLSSPTVNVLWALANFVIGYLLLRVGKLSQTNKWSLLSFFAGVVCFSIMLSIQLAGKVH